MDETPSTTELLMARAVPWLMLLGLAAVVWGFVARVPLGYVGAGLFLVAYFLSRRSLRYGGPFVLEMARKSARWTAAGFEWRYRDNELGRSAMETIREIAARHGYHEVGEPRSQKGTVFTWQVTTFAKDR